MTSANKWLWKAMAFVGLAVFSACAAVAAEEVAGEARPGERAPSKFFLPATLSHDDGAMDGKEALLESGHAVLFDVSGYLAQGDLYLERVALFASRYGYPAPPERDVTIGLCNEEMKPFAELDLP